MYGYNDLYAVVYRCLRGYGKLLVVLLLLLTTLVYGDPADRNETEPNNDCANATILLDSNNTEVASGWVYGTVTDGSDSDWYKVELSQKTRMRFKKQTLNSTLTQIDLYKSDCTTSAGWSEAKRKVGKNLLLDAGTYYLRLSRHNKDNAKYRVKVYARNTVDFDISKSVDSAIKAPGDRLIYTIRVKNQGQKNGKVDINDTLPHGLNLVSVNADRGLKCTTTNQTLLCSSGAIKPGEEKQITIEATVDSATSGVVTNRVVATATEKYFDTNLSNNSDSVDIVVMRAIWQMDACYWEGTRGEVKESSSNHYNGDAFGVSTTQGLLCRAGDFRLDANSDYVALDGTILDGTNALSVAMWIKTDKDKGQALISGAKQGGFMQANELLLYLRNKTTIRPHIHGYSVDLTIPNIADNQWHHIVWTREDKANCIYVDGIHKSCGTITHGEGAVGIEPNGLYLGQDQDSVGGGFKDTKDFEGVMDEVTLFRTRLSDRMVKRLYDNEKNGFNYDGTPRSCQVCAIAPRAEYRMDACHWNGSAGEVKEHSIHHFDGRSSQVDTMEGRLCRGGDFYQDSKEDYLTLDHRALSGLDAFSVAVWLKTTTKGQQAILSGAKENTFNGANEALLFLLNSTTIRPHIKNKFIDLTIPDIADNQWHHIVWTRSGKRQCIYVDGANGVCGTIDTTGAVSIASGGLILGQEQDSLGGGFDARQDFEGVMDEVKIYDTNLTRAQVELLYDRESHNKSWDGRQRLCQTCQHAGVYFNAVDRVGTSCDAVRDWDNNLTTQVDGKGFGLYILAQDAQNHVPIEANLTRVVLHGCNGSGYYQDITSHFPPKTTPQGCTQSTTPIVVNESVKCLGVTIQGFDSNGTQADDLNESNATDHFAVRPDHFTITSTVSHKAGETFTLPIVATNYGGGGSLEYNETTTTGSFALEYNETKPHCHRGSLTLEDVNFTNGMATPEGNYSEVGEVTIRIHEVNGSEFAHIDSDDTPDAQRLIAPYNGSLTFTPHHFDLETHLRNFNQSTFTYLSNDLAMSAEIAIAIASKNEANVTTQNYTPECYGKDVTITLTHSPVASSQLHTLYAYYQDANASDHPLPPIGKNDTLSLRYPASNFSLTNSRVTQAGESQLNLYFNFNRSVAHPSNPFDLNLSRATLSDGTTSSQGYESLNGEATFYYGKLYAEDVTTSLPSVTHTARIEIYDDNLSDPRILHRRQRTLGWYGFGDRHDSMHGVVSQSRVGGDQRGQVALVSLVPSAHFYDKFGILYSGARDHSVRSTIHLAIPSWLWYAPYSANPYDSNLTKGCERHPCFHYRYRPVQSHLYSGVKSGQQHGLDFTMREGNVTRRGIKLFR